VAEHIEDDAAALGPLVVPGRPLRDLPIAFEHPVASPTRYDEAAATLAWARTIAFFRELLIG
jgi:dienelactone hydrolase